MNELLDSDQERNAADLDEEFSASDIENFDIPDEESLIDSDLERSIQRKRKDREAKINNSFTGPYPVDPTDFNHTDKGPNFQFAQLLDDE